MGPLGPRATAASPPSGARELQRLKPEGLESALPREATATRSSCTVAREQPPLATTRESPPAAAKTQHRQKEINMLKPTMQWVLRFHLEANLYIIIMISERALSCPEETSY